MREGPRHTCALSRMTGIEVQARRPYVHAMQIEVWRGVPPARVASDFSAIVRSDRVQSVFTTVASHGGIVLAATACDEVRGYATLLPDLPDTFELGSIEVARSVRGHGIGTALLAQIESTLPVDRLALFARGVASHWETTFAKLTPTEYRRMLLRMLGRIGFERWDTTDPDVDFLAVRTGRDLPTRSLVALMQRASSQIG